MARKTPLERLLSKLGGTKEVARAFNVPAPTVRRWKSQGLPKSRLERVNQLLRGAPAPAAGIERRALEEGYKELAVLKAEVEKRREELSLLTEARDRMLTDAQIAEQWRGSLRETVRLIRNERRLVSYQEAQELADDYAVDIDEVWSLFQDYTDEEGG